MKQYSFNCERVLGQELCTGIRESTNHLFSALQGTDTLRLKITQGGCTACGRPVSVVIYYYRQVRFSIWAILLQICNVLFMPSLKSEIWRKWGGCTCVYLYWLILRTWFSFCSLVLRIDCCSWMTFYYCSRMTFFLIMFVSSQCLIWKISDTVEL